MEKRRRKSVFNSQFFQDIRVLRVLLGFTFSLFISSCTSVTTSYGADPSYLTLALAGGFIVSLVTLVNIDIALIVLIFSMLFSPEIPVAQLPQRAVVVRLDDIFIIFLFFSWLGKMALNKQLGLFKRTPISRPMSAYVMVYVVTTSLAIFLGLSKAKFLTSFFYLLKYVEYLMLFILVANNIKSIRQCKIFTFVLLLSAFIICIYGYVQIQSGVWRVSAPFEGGKTEPNTMAGYLVLIMGLAGGLFIHAKTLSIRIILGLFLLFVFPVFLFTLSRGGYISFISMYAIFFFLSKKERILFLYLAFVLVFTIPAILPSKVANRIERTFTGKTTYEIMGEKLVLDEAAAARIETWKYVFEMFKKSPLIGHGVAGIDFVDTQYGMVLGEAGVIGVGIFFWLMTALFNNAYRIYKNVKDDYVQGLSLGFVCSLAALLIMGLGANTFIIVRIMEPFWFIAALVLISPGYVKGPAEKAQEIIGT